MAEVLERKEISKKSKVLDEEIPELPDLNEIQIYNNKSEIVENVTEETEELQDESADVCQIDVKTDAEEIYPTIDFTKLYPSITENPLVTEEVQIECNSLDIVRNRIVVPEVPVEEWRLPDPMPLSELRRFYDNSLLENLEEIKQDFQREARDGGCHPLADLLEAFQRAQLRSAELEKQIRVLRTEMESQTGSLWTTTERSGTCEGRCRDNAVVKKTYKFDEARFQDDGARRLEQGISSLSTSLVAEWTQSCYATTLARERVQQCVAVLLAAGGPRDPVVLLRGALADLCAALRSCCSPAATRCIHDWLVAVGGALAARASPVDLLWLTWQLLRLPKGAPRRFSSLLYIRDPLTAVAALSLLAEPQSSSLATTSCDSEWAVVDSEGETEGDPKFSTLSEDDFVALLGRIPIATVFRNALGVPESTPDLYEPSNAASPDKLVRLMSFCASFAAILDQALNTFDRSRWRTLNKHVSRLLKHTIQFLTDHLEAVLKLSISPGYNYLLSAEIQMQMLAQYESVYESVLKSLIRHRRQGNWQCLTDLPWRMLSPHCKWSFLTYLIDWNQTSVPPTDSEWWLNNLQVAIEPLSEDDTIYLLTVIANLALEIRPNVGSETSLLSTVTNLLFQICYVIPATRTSFSKVGRELLSSICLQHPRTLSTILESVKLWHPTVGQMGLFLFRELPFCLMMPSDSEFRLLSSWLIENSPTSVCNQMARYVLSNLNWGFSNPDETLLYLPLSLHQRMATLLITSYKRHAVDVRAGNWFITDSIKLVTNLWWNQENYQDQSFHSWCLGLSIRLRLHPSTRLKVTDPLCLQLSSVINTSDWISGLVDAQQDKCNHPVAMYMAVTTSKDFQSFDDDRLRIIQNLVTRHQQYRMCLELLSQIIVNLTPLQFSMLLNNSTFLNLWRLLIHADDTYYNMVKNLISKKFPGPVLSCIGNTYCPSVIMANGDKDRQEVVLKFFLCSVVNQPNWFSDQSLLWLLDKILEVNVGLNLKTGSEEFFLIVKEFNNKQFADVSKRSGIAQIFRLGSTFNPLLTQLASGEYPWLKSFILEAEASVENEAGLWKEFLRRLLIRKKREPRTVTSAMASACKHLRLGLTCYFNSLVIIQAVQLLGSCPPDHLALVKVAVIFFQRYLGLARVWDHDLAGLGSAGHRIFLDDTCHPLLLQARTNITSAKNYQSSQLDSLRQNSATNVSLIDQTKQLFEKLEMLLLWIDEPRIHLEDVSVSGLPSQYRPDLLSLVRLCNINMETFCFPRRSVLEQSRKDASLWDTRHDLDMRFIRLVISMLSKPSVPLEMKLLKRFKRQLSMSSISEPASISYDPIVIPASILSNTTQLLEYISGPLSIMYQSAAKYNANRNVLADLNKKYFIALPKQYEQQSVSKSVQMHCNRGPQFCTGEAVLAMTYQTWVKRNDIIADTVRNRKEFNKLVDEIIQFANVDQLAKGIVCVEQLILRLDSQLPLCRNQEEFQKVVDCGLALFFYLGRQINTETQSYPPHRDFAFAVMELLGSKFMRYGSNQANVLLNEMLDNELLVEVYNPHFNPNSDTSSTANMYLKVVENYVTGKCSQTMAHALLLKFSMIDYIDQSPTVTSKLSMVDCLCTSFSYARLDQTGLTAIDKTIEEIHVNNFVLLLASNFTLCLPQVLQRFRTWSDSGKLGARFWLLGLKCVQDNITENRELVLSIEEIRKELSDLGDWFHNCRFTDSVSKKHGLYMKHGASAWGITNICSVLVNNMSFKLCRSARENIVSWREVVEKIWDLFLKIYVPWIQAFCVVDANSQTTINFPWRVEEEDAASKVVELATSQLNTIVSYLSDTESQSFLLHCTLIWVSNGLLLVKELPIKPYHETYCLFIKDICWNRLEPSLECVQMIIELLSRPSMSEQCRGLFLDISSQMKWMQLVPSLDREIMGSIFELVVVMICKCKSAFQIPATEKLADVLIELSWNFLAASDYRKGMDKVVANLEPRIILCNPSTIEGKIIKLLNHATGCSQLNEGKEPQVIDTVIEKQTIYVSTVVKLLSVAFSFTQNKNKGKNAADDNQMKLFQLRISGLFTEIENIVVNITQRPLSERMAICVLTEIVQLFKNQTIAFLAMEPVIEWLQESQSSPLILPFLVILFKCSVHISAIVRLAEELMEAFIMSEKSDGGHTSWATIAGCVHLDTGMQHMYWNECVKQGSLLCLVQQILAHLSSVTEIINMDQWQSRIVDWLEKIRPQRAISEYSMILMIFFYLIMLEFASKASSKPSFSFKNMLQLLLKMSESKNSSGFLGKVGLGKKSDFSFEFRILCRSLSVFLHVQLPTNNILRVHANDPGAVTSPDMVIPSRNMGEALPTNKTLQNLDWLKSQRTRKEVTAITKTVLDNNIDFICNPQHCISDSSTLLRSTCRKLWPDNKLLNLIYSFPVQM